MKYGLRAGGDPSPDEGARNLLLLLLLLACFSSLDDDADFFSLTTSVVETYIR